MDMGHERVTVVLSLLKNIPMYQFLKHSKEAIGLKATHSELKTHTGHTVDFLNVLAILKVHAYI